MPNEMPGAIHYVRTNMATPTAGVGIPPTWRGSSMDPHTVVQQLPGASFEAQGKGVFYLAAPGRFPRGPRLSGRQGSMDLFVRVGEQGEVAATGILTSTVTGLADSDTVTIDGKVYTFEDSLTNTNGHVHVGVDAAESLFNLVSAINLSGGVGTRYATATTLHPTVSAAGGPGLTMVATAKTPGPGVNALATTEVSPEASWGGATLSGGTSTASTMCYLADDPTNPQEVIAIGLDSSNRPTALLLIRPLGGSTTVAVGVLTLAGNMADVAATGTLNSSGQVSDGNTVTIGVKTYTFQATLLPGDGNVKIGASQALSMENLRRAINLDGTAGVNYGVGTTLHPTVSALDTATTVDVTAKTKGEEGNSIISTENSATLDWDDVTLVGGANDKVTIDTKTYKFQTTLTNFDDNVQIRASASDSIDNLIAAITLTGTPGTDYATAMTLHPTVTATAGAGDTMDATAKTPGAAGNLIATTETSSNASWGAATLLGGSGGPVTVAEVTPSGAAFEDGTPLNIRLTWDSLNPVEGVRHASFTVNGVPTPSGDWSTDPTASWEHFQPTALVLGQGYGGAADFDGIISAWQGSETVSP